MYIFILNVTRNNCHSRKESSCLEGARHLQEVSINPEPSRAGGGMGAKLGGVYALLHSQIHIFGGNRAWDTSQGCWEGKKIPPGSTFQQLLKAQPPKIQPAGARLFQIIPICKRFSG